MKFPRFIKMNIKKLVDKIREYRNLNLRLSNFQAEITRLNDKLTEHCSTGIDNIYLESRLQVVGAELRRFCKRRMDDRLSLVQDKIGKNQDDMEMLRGDFHVMDKYFQDLFNENTTALQEQLDRIEKEKGKLDAEVSRMAQKVEGLFESRLWEIRKKYEGEIKIHDAEIAKYRELLLEFGQLMDKEKINSERCDTLKGEMYDIMRRKFPSR